MNILLLTYTTLIQSSVEYKYLSICVSPASTSHNKMSPKEAVVLIMPKMHKFREFIGARSRGYRCFRSIQCSSLGARDGTVVRVLASHQSGPGSNPGVNAICGLSLLLVLSFAPRGFSPATPVFPSSKTNISKFQFNRESGR